MKTSKSRLNGYRNKANLNRVRQTSYPAADNWRYWKRNIWQSSCISRSTDGRQWFVDDKDTIGEYVGDAHKILPRLGHTGWYCDNYQDGLIIGGVVRLRSSKGTFYIPLTYCTRWDGATLHWCDAVQVDRGSSEEGHDDAMHEAARYADRCAELEAEQSREDDAKFQAECQIETARYTIHEINRQCMALIREIKQHGAYGPAVCSALRQRLADMLANRADQFRTIAARQDNYWTACPGY